MEKRIRHLGGHVVVGVDGSEPASRAVRAAAAEAARRGVPLQVLHAADPAHYEYQSGPTAYAAAHELVDAAARRALETAPWLDVERTVVRATPAGTLLDVSDDAGLIVIGSRGLGPLSGLALGSVGLSLAGRSRCPVLVVRDVPEEYAARPHAVVVGVSGKACTRAVELALHEAALRGIGLRALHAWTMPMTQRSGASPAEGGAVASTRARARARLAEVVADTRHSEPGVRVIEDVVRDSAARALIAASRHADLLVLAARRRPPGMGLHVGPVTHAVLHRAHCPVLVVPVAARKAATQGPNGPGRVQTTP